MTKLTTVLFDFDGTLADTNQLIAASHLHVLDHYFPGQYDADAVKPFNGPSLEQTYSQLNPEQAAAMIAMYREFNHEAHDDYIKVFPGVVSALAELQERGLRLAVVSTKYEYVLRRGLELLGLTPYFDVILAGDHCQEVKPHPEQLQRAMSHLQVTPAECVMVGDNWQDIEAGRRAGVQTVFVEWSEKSLAEIAPYNPNKTVASMLELNQWIKSQNDGGKL